MGHVQSGKTANYAGLICKAADAGYKLVVVLAGMHKNLRSQTQIRLDEAFLGYDSTPVKRGDRGARRSVGVGSIDPSIMANTITNRLDDGDFKRSVAENFNIQPGGLPLLFVVKKNASVLKNILSWVEWAADDGTEDREAPGGSTCPFCLSTTRPTTVQWTRRVCRLTRTASLLMTTALR